MSKQKNRQETQAVAVFADCQNVGSLFDHRQAVLTFIEQFGSVPWLCAYEYWRKMKPRRQSQLHQDGWQTLDVPTQTKNALDELLIRDCRRLGGEPFVNVVVLILGDKDFAPLARWLISQHKRVIVIGRRNHISHKLRALVPNDVYEIEDLQRILNCN